MTQEEAIKHLKQIYPNGGNCRLDEQRIEALDMAIKALSVSLPSNLDEAARLYAKVPGEAKHEWYDGGKLDGFKAGAQWRDAQIQKLPDNVEEAAEEYATGLNLGGYVRAINAFKDGAEWMAGQGESITADVVEFNGGKMLSYDGEFAKLVQKRNFGDKVIVQIRKI